MRCAVRTRLAIGSREPRPQAIALPWGRGRAAVSVGGVRPER
jgi:hypothetical protein